MPGTDSPVASLRPGQEVEIETAASVLLVTIQAVSVRNWSRIADATDADGRFYFLKQFVDRAGRGDASLMASERTSSQLAARLYPGLDVLQPLGHAQHLYLLAYPHRSFAPLTDLVDGADTTALRSATAAWARAVLHPVEDAPADGMVPAFKGIDFANVGLTDSGELVLYDLGPPARWPVARLAARLIVTTAFARWRRSPSSLLKGPPEAIVNTVVEAVRPAVDAEALEVELGRQLEIHRQAARTGSSWRRFLGGLAVRTLGARYARLASEQLSRATASSTASR